MRIPSPDEAAVRLIRVLQVVGAMECGGVETWLMNVLRNLDRTRFHLDFLVHTPQVCAYDEEIRSYGSRVIFGGNFRAPFSYRRHFDDVLRLYGPYDVVHSHLPHHSGFVLRLAARGGVRTRIAHTHGERQMPEQGAVRQMYARMMQRWVGRYATHGLADSEQVASLLFGNRWQVHDRWQVLHGGIDLRAFEALSEPGASGAKRDRVRAEVRAELGIPDDALVVGHVGRFVPAKNHAFLLDVARSLRRRAPNVWFLFVGDGPVRPEVERQVARLEMSGVVLPGARPDVARLLGAMDVFVFPSLYEGPGLALVEAQAAGLPCLVASGVSPEADVVPELVVRRGLAEGAGAWAERVLELAAGPPAITPAAARQAVRRSAFSLDHSLDCLVKLYGQ